MKYRLVIEVECESENLIDEVVWDLENAFWRGDFDCKVNKVKITGEELEYKDIKII